MACPQKQERGHWVVDLVRSFPRGTFMKHVSLVAIVALLAACGRNNDSPAAADAPAPAGDSPTVATATQPTATAETTAAAGVQLSPTQGNTANGGLKITAAGSGVKISGMVQGLQPDSEFGFHFHERGDCSAPDATSAGEHFNPTSQDHGNPRSPPHHAGDRIACGVVAVQTN